MGLSLFKFSDTTWLSNQRKQVDPNPTSFKVLDTQHVHGCTVALVEYNGCVNYGGQKLLFWNRICWPGSWVRIDPHFRRGDSGSPFARFEPTDEGVKAAIGLAQVLGGVR